MLNKRVLSPILLLFLYLFIACDSQERNPQTEGPAKNTLLDSIATEEVAVAVMAGADTTIQDNNLMNSLVPQWTVQEVMRKIPEAKITNKEAVPNRHVQGQVDTLVTIKSDSTIFQFYSMPGKDMLQSATLTKGGVTLGEGLEVGMTAEEVAQRIQPLQQKKAIPQTILIRAEQAPTSLRLRFKQNHLTFIQYDGYVD